MSSQGRGPRPKADPAAELLVDLRATFRWRGDRTDDRYLADPMGWWVDAKILGRLGEALASLFDDTSPTLVAGAQSRGSLLGALVASHLGVGLIEVRKDPSPAADSDRWITASTPPDYQNRTLQLGTRRDLIGAGDRVLFVDDWIDTGAQTTGAKAIVDSVQATWCGAAVIIDGLEDSRLRRDLEVRSLLRQHDL